MKTKEQIVAYMKEILDELLVSENNACERYCQTNCLEDIKEMNRFHRTYSFLRLFIIEVECSPNVDKTIRDMKDYYINKIDWYHKYAMDLTFDDSILKQKQVSDIQEEIIKFGNIVDLLKKVLRYANPK